jgi:hypothetical protein
MWVHFDRISNQNPWPVPFNTTVRTVRNLLRVPILEGTAVKVLIAIRIRSEEKRLGENNLEFVEQSEVDYIVIYF